MNHQQFVIRKLELKDINKEYFLLLQNLSLISLSELDTRKNHNFFSQLDKNHQIWVLEDSTNHKIIGSGTIIIENKLIRNYGKVAHLEDIVVLPEYQSQKMGKMLVKHLIKTAQENDCYKCILNCNPLLVRFYEKNNFTNYGIHMRIDID
jgi:glucosamine-phosphate N-acetyltransferase